MTRSVRLPEMHSSPSTLQPVTVGQRFDGRELPRKFLGSTIEKGKRLTDHRGIGCKPNPQQYFRLFNVACPARGTNQRTTTRCWGPHAPLLTTKHFVSSSPTTSLPPSSGRHKRWDRLVP